MISFLQQRIKSFGYAFKGIKVLFQTQTHAKIHALAAILVILAGFYFQISLIEWCLIVICIASVTAAEGINTALETLTDLVSPDFHPFAGRAKDVAAGAVLLLAIGAAIVACLIFIPKIFCFTK
jgi:diacylglycerol kinase